MAKPHPREESCFEPTLCTAHLLVWTWRKMVVGEAECRLIAREYEELAGARAQSVLDDLGTFLLLLGRGSRRVLCVGPPLCAGVTRDEAQILRLIAAAQTQDGTQVSAHLSWLVGSAKRQGVQAALQNLAASLSDCGIVLPPVPAAAPSGPAMLAVVR